MKHISSHFVDYIDGHHVPVCDYWSEPTAALPEPGVEVSEGGSRITSWEARPYFCEPLARLCEDGLGGKVVDISFPGGDDRGACRVSWEDGRTAIASYRTEPGRARLEERVLHHLNRQSAPVPGVLYYNGLLLVQEDLGGERLSSVLADADRGSRKALLAKSLESLIAIHRAAELEGMDCSVPMLGCEDSWIARHIRQLRKIGEGLGVRVPHFPREDVHDVLIPLKPRFIKWDARPGNAIVNAGGDIRWFDWEHCGARNRLDDLVWLLCDESVPFDAETEQELLAQYLPAFADGAPLEAACRYAYVAGVLHATARLGLILYKKDDEGWWDMQEILDYDYIGVTLPLAQRLCERAADWAEREPLVASLAPWFVKVSERLERL